MLKIFAYLLAVSIATLFILQTLNIVPFFVVPETTLEVPSVVLLIIAFVVGAGLASLPYVHARIRALVAPQKPLPLAHDAKAAMPLLVNAPRVTESPVTPDEPTPSERVSHQPDVSGVPVESLANGVINALGDGLGAVIDTSASTSGSVTRAIAEGSAGVLRGAKLQIRDWSGASSRKPGGKKRST